MGDMGEVFKAMKERGKFNRASNRETSGIYLIMHDIPFTVKNKGAHLIVEGSECFIDFWPGTGRWIPRDTGVAKFGVKNLVKYIEEGG